MKFKTVPETIPNLDISISIYPIPIWILPAPQKRLTVAKAAENDTGKLQETRISIHIAVTVGKKALPCHK